ncbi:MULTISPECIES: thioredoxin domain-containing protein [unclassified Paenibacillus]|uniref:thioredoxin family protein n=1 Tax=unclassified Paenibacillus TaxID=185978 RepID=UPI001043A722|nr:MULTISPECIES: thioredoxin domain-containing protein [unclassified Paenibacillus]NIK70411.1 thioredoxin 1 [Paenibacillus sp. BK720]TCM90671.1 thioredoxin 1 [Paenibacillus sp. BK033]
MEIMSLKVENFRAQIDHGITLVGFFEPECHSCQEQLPIIEELAQELRHEASFFKVNIQQEKEITNEYGITSAPTFMLFKDGYQVETLAGVQSKEKLRQTILRYAAMGDTC